MMDEFERGLSTALKAVPLPPVEIEPADILAASPRRRSGRARIIAPLLAASAVAAVVITAVLLAHSASNPEPATSSTPAGPSEVSHTPKDLYGTWELVDLQGFDGAAHTQPGRALTFRFDPSGVVREGQCMTAHVLVGPGTLTFDQNWITTLQTICALDTVGSIQQDRFLFTILGGTTSWEVRDGELAVFKGEGRVVFAHVESADPIPVSVTSVDVTVDRHGAAPTVRRTLGALDARSLAAVVNALPRFVPGRFCPMDRGFTDTLTFHQNSGEIQVHASVAGCGSVVVSTGNREGPELGDGGRVDRAVTQILGLPKNYGS